uniref:Meiosis protein 5 homolog n=1 Tax=Graphocephala atropunctata TaxID=36148 RepID=A0A1B6LJQ1_9HEMI
METPVNTKSTKVNSVGKSSLTPCRRLGLYRPSSGSLKKSLHLRTLKLASSESIERQTKDDLISIERSSSLDGEDRLKTPLKSSDVLNKTVNSKVRRCLSIKLKSPSLSAAEVSSYNNDLNSYDHSNSFKSDSQKCLECPNSNSAKRLKLDYTSTANVCEESDQTGESVTQTINGINETEKTVTSCNPITLLDNSLDTVEVQKANEISCEMIQRLLQSIKEKKRKIELFRVQEIYAKKHNLEDLRAQTTKWRDAGQEALRYSLTLARDAGYSVTLMELLTQHGFPLHLMGYSAEDDEFS